MPEFNPELFIKKGGRFLSPDNKRYNLLSEMFASSEIEIAKKSSTRAKGCPWKLPPDNIVSASGNMFGLSVTAFTSLSMISVQ